MMLVRRWPSPMASALQSWQQRPRPSSGVCLKPFQPNKNQTKKFRLSTKMMCSAQLCSPPSRLLAISVPVSHQGLPRHPPFPLRNLFQMCFLQTHSVLWIHPPANLKTAGECTINLRRVQAAPSRLQCGLLPPHILLSYFWHSFALLSRLLNRAQWAATQQCLVRVHFILQPLLSRCLT